MRPWTFQILVYKTEHIILTPSRNVCQTVNIWNMAIKRRIFYPDPEMYAKQWTFEILVSGTEHIILTPSRNMYQTVNIWNLAVKWHIFLPRHIDICKTLNIWNIGIYNWTYCINPFTEHVPNSKHLKYDYKKALILPRHRDIWKTVNIWNIFL